MFLSLVVYNIDQLDAHTVLCFIRRKSALASLALGRQNMNMASCLLNNVTDFAEGIIFLSVVFQNVDWLESSAPHRFMAIKRVFL